ncbi:expressed unknown protein [Seminavis robusta]|uniref:Uncharacterized protein n=1 Tax=Seminavis robusta TaxID=568900 RepID=A0A9N8HV70_9STRA|nr:expressed unknown protein [Seminavis robusta]|eukprot:Sro1755_g295500.1 n/a (245) ;mRNA; r:5361-6095
MAVSNSIARYNLQHAAHLANIGAHYYATRNYQSSYGAYTRALEVLQRIAHDDSVNFEPENDRDDAEARIPVAYPFGLMDEEDEDDERTKKIKAEDEDKSFFFVFAKPFVVDVETLDMSNTPIYIAVVIFGMSLLLMRKAQTEPDKRSLHKALKLFEMAATLLQSAPDHGIYSNVQLAILNNKTYICYCLHLFEDAHGALEEISELLPNVCNDDVAADTFDEDELNNMVLNSLLTSDPTRLAPAA